MAIYSDWMYSTRMLTEDGIKRISYDEDAIEKYLDFIYPLKKRFKSRVEAVVMLDCEIHEHHIVPRCLCGKDNAKNYVYLTIDEHIKAHKLLAKAYPTHRRLRDAASLLRKQNRKIKKFTLEEISTIELAAKTKIMLDKFISDYPLEEKKIQKYQRQLKRLLKVSVLDKSDEI